MPTSKKYFASQEEKKNLNGQQLKINFNMISESDEANRDSQYVTQILLINVYLFSVIHRAYINPDMFNQDT